MNLRHLETFVAVAEEASFSRAADRLHVVQSAVSAGIRGLERELGAPLFERGPRGATLTDAGTALLPEARSTLAAAAAGREAVQSAAGGLTGTVVLGIMQAMRDPAPNVAALLASFRVTHPGVRVTVRHGGGSLQMAEQIRSGALDLGFISGLPTETGLEMTLLSRQPIEFACSPDHPLAGREWVDLAMVADQTWADLPVMWGTRVRNDAAFAAAGVARQVEYDINDTSTLVEFVRHGLAVTLLPQSLIGEATGVVSIPIRSHAPTFEVSIAVPHDRRARPSVDALLTHIRASVAAQAG